jgi:hypothetical protein
MQAGAAAIQGVDQRGSFGWIGLPSGATAFKIRAHRLPVPCGLVHDVSSKDRIPAIAVASQWPRSIREVVLVYPAMLVGNAGTYCIASQQLIRNSAI